MGRAMGQEDEVGVVTRVVQGRVEMGRVAEVDERIEAHPSSALVLLESPDLVHPSSVTPSQEPGLKEGPHAGQGDLAAHDACPHREHVRVVVLAAETRRDRVGGLDAPDARDLVRHDLLARAAAAEHDSEVARALRDGTRRRRDDVGVVDRVGAMGAEIDRLVSRGPEQLDDGILERESGVVGRDGDAHAAKDTQRSYGGPVRPARVAPPAVDPEGRMSHA